MRTSIASLGRFGVRRPGAALLDSDLVVPSSRVKPRERKAPPSRRTPKRDEQFYSHIARCLVVILLVCASFPSYVLSAAEISEAEAARRIDSFLLLKDPGGALLEAREALKKFPASKALRRAYLRALSEKGEEIEAWKTFGPLFALCKEERESRFLLETLAWGSLQKGQVAQQLFVRINAMMGACFTRDARAVPILLEGLRSSNTLIRSLSAQLAATMGDKPLRQEILHLLAKEKNWHVRLTAIQAAGQLRMEEARPLLQKCIESNKTTPEEKALAIITMASLYDKVEPAELRALITSRRAGLRQLACELVAILQLSVYADDIAELINDHSPDVRMAALGALGFFSDVPIKGKPLAQLEAVHKALHDPTPSVAITAAWLLLRQGDNKAEEVFTKFLAEGQPEDRRMASAALATCGAQGIALSRVWLLIADDLYVRVNLALGLIGQRHAVSESCATLQEALQAGGGSRSPKSLWMWDETTHPLFRSLSPSRVRHIDQIPSYPLVVDQMVRLDLLSVLSKLRYPHALEAVESFLKKGEWSVIGSAAGVLLEEGNEAEIEVVRSLLHDPDEEVRIEAALLLAYWGRDPAGIDELIHAYPDASREAKIRILEALGKSGHPKAIPFLVEILGAPFQVLRIVAASALIQCLYQ